MRTKYMGAVSTAAALALVLAACGGNAGGNGGSGGGGTQGGGDGSAAPAEGRQINETPREELQQGGTLRRTVTQLPDQWNPMHVNGNQGDYTDIRDTMHPRNWDFDAEGNYTANENYLESFDEEEVDGKTKITLHLNPEAKWNSGKPITVEDYRATLAACAAAEEETTFECVQAEPYQAIESVEQGADEFEVIVTFKGGYPDWAAPLEYPLPAESVADADTFNTGWLEYNSDWFTGPYKVENLDSAQRVLTLVPNENWWGEEPLLDTITFRELEADARANAFQNNEIDVFDIGADVNGYTIANSTPNAEVRQALAPNWRHFTFNSAAGLLTDQELRQAIVMGIDRQAIADSDLSGLPGEKVVLGNHFFMADQDGYEDNSDVTPYDVEGAKAKLDELGWTEGADGIREKDGQKLTVHFTVLQGVSTSENEGNLFQNQMKEIGVDVQLDTIPSSEFSTVLDEGTFEIMAFSWLGTQFPLANIAQIYGDPAQNQSNYAKLNNPELNTLITENAQNTDPEARTTQANEIDRMIWEQVHTLPLYQRPELIATVSNLANYGAEGLSNTRAEDWGFTQ